jgi:alkylation response protein AidB-like acyl-CoA dehydrogenase
MLKQIPTLDEFRSFFLEEFETAAAEIEATDRIPPWLLQRAAEVGVYRLTVPEHFGGWELSVTEYLPYLEVAAMGPGCGRMLVHLANGIWRPLARYGTPEQQALIRHLADGKITIAFCLTERSGGTGRDLHSYAERTGDDWLVSGEKHLITFADRADYFLLIVGTDERHASDSFTAFLVPRHTPGFEIDLSQPTMGLHGTGHGFLRYNRMLLPDSARLGEVGQGLEVAFSFLDYSRVSLANCMVGLAQRALDESIAYAKRRVTFGKPIAERQAIQMHLANMHADVNAGRGLVRMAAERCERGETFTVEAATAKLFCLNMVGRVTDLALRVHGGYGYTKAAPIERLYRDARGFWFEEGTAEIQQLVIGRHLVSSQ